MLFLFSKGIDLHFDAQIADRTRNDSKSQSASGIAANIAYKYKSVEKRREITSEIAVIRISTISNHQRVALKSLATWASKHLHKKHCQTSGS